MITLRWRVSIKTELIHHRHYATREDARRDIFVYIEGFYNRTRRHSAIGYLSPIEMELKAVTLSIFSGEDHCVLGNAGSVSSRGHGHHRGIVAKVVIATHDYRRARHRRHGRPDARHVAHVKLEAGLMGDLGLMVSAPS
jgi:hypothetical protein